MGAETLRVRYEACADGCHYVNDHWKSAIAQRIGGMWYSTTAEGHCDDPASVSCRWREMEKLKIVNATCANDNVLRLVRQRGADCFASCPPDERNNETSDCATICFFETVLGNGPLFPNTTASGISGADMVAAFQAAFDSEDPAQGGCKDLTEVTIPPKDTAAVATTVQLPSSMSALRCSRAVQKEGDFSTLAIGTIPVPHPGLGEVLINVSSSSVNPVDWKVLLAGSGLPIRFPHTLGFDVAGTIAAVGPGTKRLHVRHPHTRIHSHPQILMPM